MKKIWLLTKIQLGTALDLNMSLGNKKNKKNKGILFYGGIIFVCLILSFSSFTYSFMLGSSLNMIGLTELLPELMMAVTCVVTLMTTIYKVKGILFDFKDYDMVMSLPVKTSHIVTSRLLLLYSINILFTIIIMIPAAIAYGIIARPTILFYIFSALIVFLIPLVPMILATVIGTIITVISARFKHSNIVNIIFTLALFTFFMISSFTMGDTAQEMGEITAALTKQVDSIYPLARMYRMAVINYDGISMAAFIAVSLLAFLLFAKIVGFKFKAINTNISAKHTRANYKMGSLTQTSPFAALYKKELKRFFSSTIYVLNTSISVVMMIVAAIAVLFFSKEQLAAALEIPEMASMLGALMPIIVSFMVSMVYITACSISLEGKNLWILKAAPVPPITIFQSKIAVSLTLVIPAVILDGILFSIGLKLTWKEMLFQFAMPIAYSFFAAIMGLIINLKLPNLNWTSEITVIKQSFAALVAMFSGMITAAIPFVLIVMIPGGNTFFINGVTTIVVSLLALLLYRYLCTKGEKLFHSL
jgi:ABC-2 type transport system permease protein